MWLFVLLQELLTDPDARDLSADTLLLVMSCMAASVRQACLALPAGAESLDAAEPAYGFAKHLEWETQLDVRAPRLLWRRAGRGPRRAPASAAAEEVAAAEPQPPTLPDCRSSPCRWPVRCPAAAAAAAMMPRPQLSAPTNF